ncbi:MAG TPA: hypothetical protein VIV65_00245 [Gemmatimonadaceae bacterium]
MRIRSIALLLVAGAAACDTTKVISPNAAGTRPQFALASDYQLFDIGAVGGLSSQPHAVNAAGVVFGSNNGDQYFSWTATGGVQFLTTPSGADFFPDFINDHGDILGESPLGGAHPLIHWADGRWEEFTIPGNPPLDFVAGQGINAHGDWAGAWSDQSTGKLVAFFWSATTGYHEIVTECGATPFGVNDAGQVVGTFRPGCVGGTSAFSWTPEGGFRNLGTLGGKSAVASSVNNRGDIAATVTYPDNHAIGMLISATGEQTTFPNTVGGVTTRVSGVNDRGEVVGTVQVPVIGNRPAIWDANHVMTQLSAPTGAASAVRISSNGIVIGVVKVSGVNHALVWMPNVLADHTAPTITYSGNAGTYTVDQAVNITCTPTDDLSGVKSSTCSDIVGIGGDFAVGLNTFSATAEDNAGNVGTGSTSFTVVVTAAGLSSLVNQWVSNSGVANSLTGKLAKANYDAFRNEVRAQAGKQIPADKAATLLRLAANQ